MILSSCWEKQVLATWQRRFGARWIHDVQNAPGFSEVRHNETKIPSNIQMFHDDYQEIQ